MIDAYVEGLPIPSSSNFFTRLASVYRGGGRVKCWFFSALINYTVINNIVLNTAIYSGFRNPNIDDLGKVFSKNSGTVVVPNKNLDPEKITSYE